MSESVGTHNAAQKDQRLAEAIRDVKNAIADRADVVVELRHAQHTRLELLADELKPVFAQADEDDDRFDFAISSGAQPRLWIDAVAHVAMGRDRRVYRFLRDTRNGRVVLAESADMKAIASQVTRYIAERIVERRQVIEDDASRPARAESEADAPAARFAETEQHTAAAHLTAMNDTAPEVAPAGRDRGSSVLRTLGLLLLGLVIGASIIAVIARDRLDSLGINLDSTSIF